MGLQPIGVFIALFAFTISNPCLNVMEDKNDGLKIFTNRRGIVSNDFPTLGKREISGFAYKAKRSIDGIFMYTNDNVLYADENDLISNPKNRIFLPLYVFRTKHLLVKTRKTRAAIVDCPWEDGVTSSTQTDFYSKKPSDIKTVNVKIEQKSEQAENIATAESTLIFRPLFAYRKKSGYRRGYRIRP